MGYTHYWYKKRIIHPKTFKTIVDDFNRAIPLLEQMGVHLRGGDGTGEPEVNYNLVEFNGDRLCGHDTYDLGIIYPTTDSSIRTRACSGDCSHETLYFPRKVSAREEPTGKIAYTDQNGQPVLTDPEYVGKYFDFCKTAFKPYDLAVTIFLVIAQHYLKENIIVDSDGKEEWYDTLAFCQKNLGYGYDFHLGAPKKITPLLA